MALLSVACLVACGAETSAPRARMVARAHMSMGSEVRVTAWTSDEAVAQAAIMKVFAEFDRLDALLSIWKPGSDVLRINAAAGRVAVPVNSETREVLQMARQMSEWTEGKFDITFGALADIWKFDHDQDNRVPTPAEIAARRPLVNYRSVVVDETAGTAHITRAGARMHLGGIGKGYAVDRAVAILRASGLHDFMVQAGGDLFVAGQAGDGPWRLGIQDPRGAPNESFATIELRDRTFSTSGDYERSFVQNGQRYHHILDPATGEPARASVSVTIVATTAMVADGLSKGVFILGPQAGMALVERLPDVEAVIVDASNQVLISSGLQGASVGRPFMGRLKILHPPTNRRP
jgi:thiamine biosynthesis lipoprotein